jgi:hypothetical protein
LLLHPLVDGFGGFAAAYFVMPAAAISTVTIVLMMDRTMRRSIDLAFGRDVA